jgi:hypothetical protein
MRGQQPNRRVDIRLIEGGIGAAKRGSGLIGILLAVDTSLLRCTVAAVQPQGLGICEPIRKGRVSRKTYAPSVKSAGRP